MNALRQPRRAALASLATFALMAACTPTGTPRWAPAGDATPRTTAATTTEPLRAPVAVPAAQSTLVAVALDGADPRHTDHAVRALLTNLIDDGDPPRFNDPQWPIVCAENSSVSLDGQPLTAGERVPAGSFTLAFTLDGACPLGDGGPLLFGSVRLLVVRDDEQGLVPLVLAPR